MTATSRFSFGDVVLVPFPLADQSGAKKRPAVVDWQAAGLIKASVLKPVFTTIKQGPVIRTMGSLATVDAKTLREVVGDVIG